MSFSDSESSHGGTGEYKFFKPHSRDRLLYEMLGASKSGDARSAWKVLIMDRVTVKVMSHSCKMADITDQGVSLVEDLFRRRQPLPSMDAIYFIQPSKENVVMFLSDMSGREPLYRKAYVFFSRPIPKELVNHIKCDTSVLPRIGALREMNLEYFSIDNQAFVTDQDPALGELFSEDAEKSRRFETCLSTMAARLASVFASLKELPTVRYQAPKTDDSVKARDLVPSKLAEAVYSIISTYKAIPNFPQTETCDLLILDRSIDQIAPIIHEWTYDAMCHDLLQMDGNKYAIELPSKTGGGPEKKEVLLEEHDPLWLELRHTHIADASERLYEKLNTFKSKNKAAQIQRGGETSTRELQKIVQALPQYNEQMEKLSLHVELAGQINTIMREEGLRDLGQVEQDLVFGDAGAKEVIAQLRKMQDSSPESKLRLLMIYAIVYPEKFEGDKGAKLMQLAKLSPEDMKVIDNMRLLARSPETKTAKSSFSLKFDNSQKAKHAARQDRTGEDDEGWTLCRFFPMVEELIEKLSKRELPKTEYAYVSEPAPAPAPAAQGGSSRGSARTASSAQSDKQGGPRSVRSRRTVRPASLDDGRMSDSVLKNAPPTDTKKMGQRIFVFIIGGATRSELRACHKLTGKLKREIVLGSSSIDDPLQYITKLKLLSEKDLAVAPEPKLW